MFGHIFYFRNFGRIGEDFDMEDDDGSPYHSYGNIFKTLYMLAFMGEFEAAYFDVDGFNEVFFFLFILIIVLIMMNVLIAIVSEAYEDCMATSHEIYWSIFYEQVTEYSMLFQRLMNGSQLMNRLKKYGNYDREKVKELLKEEMIDGDRAVESGTDRKTDLIYQMGILETAVKEEIRDIKEKICGMENRIMVAMQK